MDAGKEKRAARRAARETLAEIGPDRWLEISLSVCRRLADAPEYLRAKSVFCFVGFGAEIDTRPFLRRVLGDGKTLYVPRCRAGGEMDAVMITGEDALSPGMFGIPEPPASFPAGEKSAVDLAVVPCLAADAEGRRLGRGGGYYDRFLRDFGGMTLLVCPEKLLWPRVPVEAWDRACGRVITEDRG